MLPAPNMESRNDETSGSTPTDFGSSNNVHNTELPKAMAESYNQHQDKPGIMYKTPQSVGIQQKEFTPSEVQVKVSTVRLWFLIDDRFVEAHSLHSILCLR